MKKLLLVVLLLMSLLLAACDAPITRGYVYNKQYTVAQWDYTPGYTTRSCTKRSCYTVYHPGYVYYQPAHYYLELTTCSSLQTDGQPGSGCKTGEVEVDQETYDATKIGSYYEG